MSDKLWQTKVAARMHDPAEKAFKLLTDPKGHEGGTMQALRHCLFPEGIPKDMKEITEHADHWASAADRPQFSQDAAWTQVCFANQPELKHPLTGETADLGSLQEVDFKHVQAMNQDHFQKLIMKTQDGAVDWQKTAWAFWRFASELDAKGLKQLWKLLPADTRVPDHTIWSHLDLTSAFAGAMVADKEANPALLVMSFGPVQSFISQARSTSDLWAGSHLLSRMTWEALKVICESCGPDALLFPQLQGVPQVDAWLMAEGAWPKTIPQPKWMKQGTDSNPLFSAALPNRFVAIVPADQAVALAKKIKEKVRAWVMTQGEAALEKLVAKAKVQDAAYAKEQLQRHLADFPDVYWLAVPWSLVRGQGKDLDDSQLREALSPFYPEGEDVGFLDSDAWKLLCKEIQVDDQRFYQPNAGVLYPALFDLLERANASVKSLRTFQQQPEEGYRCSLCAEREWLTTHQSDLWLPVGRRKAALWQRVPESWSRKGKEHLCGLCTLKRLWPTLYVDEVREITQKTDIHRFVVSTHTMALVGSLKGKFSEMPPSLQKKLEDKRLDTVALPKKMSRISKKIAKLPALLDHLSDDSRAYQEVSADVKTWLDHKPEAYYAFIMLDGDKMGAWLAGNEDFTQLAYKDCWHSQLKNEVQNKAQCHPELKTYLAEKRPSSPARHAAISSALNNFALHLTRYAVEEAHHGKLIYAGGDDVLAMIPVGELTSCMLLLRLLYSGHVPAGIKSPEGMQLNKGFVLHNNALMRVMGAKATASAGAVVAHHQTPLQRVLKEVRAAEHTAKNAGGRDAFSIRILKRAGGTVSVTAKWFAAHSAKEQQHPICVLQELAVALGGKHMSRRAAYHSQAWLRELPGRDVVHDDAMFERMLKANLQRQFKQQGGEDSEVALAGVLADMACVTVQQSKDAKAESFHEAQWLESFLSVAEFLGREGRMGEAS